SGIGELPDTDAFQFQGLSRKLGYPPEGFLQVILSHPGQFQDGIFFYFRPSGAIFQGLFRPFAFCDIPDNANEEMIAGLIGKSRFLGRD
ncbi:hypothetical protein, partial [Psychroserpens mesophilus]|uniref:hypothetical protein n=1 Tax=Psychroserpens mesophilus TaxID=325473 RepID=UPI003D652C22